ncbi:MAG TPA: MBL fold metallo-hydrolase [Gemmatimonadales bacterium]|jgi:phosphoribosyl 1,2-cyclic phosphodiesterase
MRLTVLGSGSRGNAVLVESGNAALLIDAGFHLKELAGRLERAGCATDRIQGIALTHEHGDHCRGVARASRTWGIPVAASAGTLAAVGVHLHESTTRMPLFPARPMLMGSWRLTAFPTAHDAREPVMLIVEDPDGRRLGVAYDVGSPTAALRHAFRGLDALIIESNHDEVLLRSSDYPPSVRARIAGRAGHLSNNEAARLISDVAHPGLAVVVLAHLSEHCNMPTLALETTKAALRGTAFSGIVVVATQDQPTDSFDVGASLQQLVLPLR